MPVIITNAFGTSWGSSWRNSWLRTYIPVVLPVPPLSFAVHGAAKGAVPNAGRSSLVNSTIARTLEINSGRSSAQIDRATNSIVTNFGLTDITTED